MIMADILCSYYKLQKIIKKILIYFWLRLLSVLSSDFLHLILFCIYIFEIQSY